MRTLFLTVITCLSLLVTIDTFAEMGIYPEYSWQVGGETSYIRYKEPGIMQEQGLFYGVAGSYSYKGGISTANPHLDYYLFRAEGRVSIGEVDYQNSGDIDSITDYIIELRGLGGLGFMLSESITITPYIGIAYRYLNDDMEGHVSTSGALGYERESNYYYSPIGVEGEIDLGNNWSVGATVEYDHFWFGKQISHLSNARQDFNDPENRQNKGFGLRGALRLIRKTEKLDFILEPFIRYWHIGSSQEADLTFFGAKIGTATEPKNKSTEYGLRLALKF